MKSKQENYIKEIFEKKKHILKDKAKKILISKYEELIPMYDIYSERIYPITKNNLHYRLIECHYRFLTEDIVLWINNKYKKYKDDKNKDNINIILNYDIPTLIETSYRVLYENSKNLGLNVSICKRNSFNKFSKHLIPYYSKDELLKLGLNMGILNKNENINMNDLKIHYMICKKISKNDISSDEIIRHNKFIIENKLISLISNYSFMGSYFMNRYLRNQSNFLSDQMINTINKLGTMINNSPKLDKPYFLYRFIWDDDFLKDLKIGSVFTDKGFISTTRDPFYSPGIKSNFGLILLKIKIPSNVGTGLLIENFSLFPKEEEFLLPPNSKLKLISKDDKFKYYHTNDQFEKLIKTKYELEFVKSDFKSYSNKDNFYNFNEIKEIDYDQTSKIDAIKIFIENNKSEDGNMFLKVENKNYVVHYNWFDGTDSYSKFYHNDTRNGLSLIVYDENMYPYINIEFGEEMVVNNLNRYYYYDEYKKLDEIDFKFINILAYNFYYKKYILYLEFNNFSKVTKEDDNSYIYSELYCDSIYKYFKSKTKFFSNITNLQNFIKYDIGYWKLNKLANTKLPDKMYQKLSNLYSKNITIGELIVDIVENHFYYYSKLQNLFSNFDITDIFEKPYVEIDIESYYKSLKQNMIQLDIPYDNNQLEKDNDYKLIFRQPIRRIF